MTAVVGILNTSAVAIAADSAVTVSNGLGEKIYNTANKIFQLSKHYPVGIAVYNSASFLMTPWEVIIKMYRKQLEDRSFDTVSDYKDDFISFLLSKDLFANSVGLAQSLNATMFNLLDSIWDIFLQQQQLTPGIFDPNQALIDIRTITEGLVDTYSRLPRIPGDYQQWSEIDLLQKIQSDVDINIVINSHTLTQNGLIDHEFTQVFKKLLYAYLLSSNFDNSTYTGLVFVGYGEKQIFPQCQSIEIAEVIDMKMRWIERTNTVIDENLTASIQPFAQKDVIQTLIDGVAPDLRQFISGQFSGILDNFMVSLVRIVNPTNPQLAAQLGQFNTQQVLQELIGRVREYQQNFFIGPTLSSVVLFSKEDLAELAESMIFLTYLKKRMTFTQENVSKPVDVAIISKGDGFIWVKRKYYFDQALNPHFLRNYFRGE